MTTDVLFMRSIKNITPNCVLDCIVFGFWSESSCFPVFSTALFTRTMSTLADARRCRTAFVPTERHEKKKDEELLGQMNKADSNRTVEQKTEMETLSQVVPVSLLRHTQRVLRKEAALWHRALVMERRAALLDLLEQDRQQYTLELNRMGKAFYMLRI